MTQVTVLVVTIIIISFRSLFNKIRTFQLRLADNFNPARSTQTASPSLDHILSVL